MATIDFPHSSDSDPALDFEVIVVGGGAAGLAGALQLARSRRKVVVVDAGHPRNAPAAHMHSYLGHDGRPPAEFLAIGREEVLSYGAEIISATVTQLEHGPDGTFVVTLDDHRQLRGRRVLMATGLVDRLPDIPGVAEQWGSGVLHCPYCHGWEVRDKLITVIGTSPISGHQAMLFRQLSDTVTIVLTEPELIASEEVERLIAIGVKVIFAEVAEVLSRAGAIIGVRLGNDDLIESDVVVVAPDFMANTTLLEELGVVAVPAPMGVGTMIETDGHGATSLPGLHAVGNLTDVSHQVLQAAAEASKVAAVMNAEMASEDAHLALELMPRDGSQEWDRRYSVTSQRWSGHPNATLVAETEALHPGDALDVGCGEGADALWLAERGWNVVGLDISQVALDRAQEAEKRKAEDLATTIEWRHGDVATQKAAATTFDLVSVHYPAIRNDDSGTGLKAIVDAVAPGGTLLFVGHDLSAAHAHHHGDFDPSKYLQVPQVLEALTEGWLIEVNETRPRVLPPGTNGPNVPDVVLKARRIVS